MLHTGGIYYKATRPKNWLGRVRTVFFTVYWRWAMYTNFSTQDFRAVNPQRYDTPEHLHRCAFRL